MVIQNVDGTITFKKGSLEGNPQDVKRGKGLTIPAQVIVPIFSERTKK